MLLDAVHVASRSPQHLLLALSLHFRSDVDKGLNKYVKKGRIFELLIYKLLKMFSVINNKYMFI